MNLSCMDENPFVFAFHDATLACWYDFRSSERPQRYPLYVPCSMGKMGTVRTSNGFFVQLSYVLRRNEASTAISVKFFLLRIPCDEGI